MVNGIHRAFHVAALDMTVSNVKVYCIADGVAPFCAAALCLFIENGSWQYISIDPLMEYDTIHLNPYDDIRDRIHVVKSKTEDYLIDNSHHGLSIVVACHSHAPCQDFWDRVACPKLAIIMPCCGKGKAWSTLDEVPIDEYEDFEVISPKRKVSIYYRTVSNSIDKWKNTCKIGRHVELHDSLQANQYAISEILVYGIVDLWADSTCYFLQLSCL